MLLLKMNIRRLKNTYTAERFVWITKLNNLRIQENGLERALSDNERLMLIEQPYEKAKINLCTSAFNIKFI